MKQVIIIIGPPGSGKGTQAELLADKFGLVNFEISKIIEEKFKNADPNNEIIAKEKDKWLAGELLSSELIVQWTEEKIREFASRGKGIVLSGNPRTIHEARKEMPIFEELYGKENIKVISIELSEEESVKRNSTRRICTKNRHAIPNFSEFEGIRECPKDGSPITTRPLDHPEIIKNRYQVFLKETLPILDLIQNWGYNITRVNGEQLIDKVQEDILNKLNGTY